MKFECPTWDSIYEQVYRIAYEIKKNEIEFKPDILVGIARGGWIPARILSDMLATKNLYNFHIEFYSSVGEHTNEPRIIEPLVCDVRGKSVLLIDDIADTGKSLSVAKKYIMEKGAGSIRIATIYMKISSETKPDFYASKTDAWVIFPWEIKETLQSIDRRNFDKTGIDKDLINKLLKI